MRRFTTSAALALGLFAAAAAQQPPDKKPAEKKADPADAAVAAALAHDPDVKVARAKVQLAEAELAKAKQAVVLRVMSLQATVNEQKQAVVIARARLVNVENLLRNKVVSDTEVLIERAKLEAAQAAVARVEMELKLLTGGHTLLGAEPTPGDGRDPAVASALRWLVEAQGDEAKRATAALTRAGLEAYWSAHAVKGPVPDRIRAALDKTVKLAPRGEKISFEKALEVFKKEAGLDIPVRHVAAVLPVTSEGEELPVGAWFQLFADGNPDVRFVVREYGLLVTLKDAAPSDAPAVFEFWKQKPPAAAKKEAAPEPKPR